MPLPLPAVEAFREYVNAWLAETHTSAAGLSARAEIDQSLLSKYLHVEERRRVRPSPRNLEKLAPVLGVGYEDLMRMCGYLPGPVTTGTVQSELNARLGRLEQTLSKYPRAFWLAVIEASERMAEAAEALHAGNDSNGNVTPHYGVAA